MEQILYIVGQVFGIIAIALGFASYQMRTQKQILVTLSATAIALAVHYGLIGAYPAMAMNIVNIFRNIVYNHRNNTGRQDKFTPILFAVIQAVMGILTWNAWYSVFVVAGIVINSYCMSFSNPQNVRKSLLVSTPLVLIYNVFVMSIGGVIFESFSLVSSVLGIIRHRQKPAK